MNGLADGLSYPQDIHSPYAYNLGDKNIDPKMRPYKKAVLEKQYMIRKKLKTVKKIFLIGISQGQAYYLCLILPHTLPSKSDFVILF